MFKSMAADLAGTSDNCTPIPREKWNDPAHGDSMEFLRAGEKVQVYLKSKIFEFIFTDLALIRVERDNASGVKRTIGRQEWVWSEVGVPKFTTPGAGMTDFACEIDCFVGNKRLHIEIVKSEMAFGRKLFLCLNELCLEMVRNKQYLAQANTLKTQILANADPATLVGMLSVTSRDLINAYDPVNFGHVFERCMGRAGHE